ncbi:hypothetical protein H8S95_18155 [Pontibacter sp. KCTC 32443]|uniref:hypothetical protein n=1 Tax=Pontibacter TaxID=323449 RepID=UPI00164DB6D0|nr:MULTISPECIES: hypothetical protein [Pontibacter]MBC5776005.1 hypothetical protein [Pontibacter sp. KCTC 32443]
MKKIKMNLLAVGVVAVGLLAACTSENTTGVEAGETNTENQSDMSGETGTDMGTTGTDTATTGTSGDTSNQNPPTDEGTGNQNEQ